MTITNYYNEMISEIVSNIKHNDMKNHIVYNVKRLAVNIELHLMESNVLGKKNNQDNNLNGFALSNVKLFLLDENPTASLRLLVGCVLLLTSFHKLI